MKIIKNVLSVFSFVLLLTASNSLSANTNPLDWKSQMTDYLTNWEYTNTDNLPDKIYVDFIITDSAEIIVLSTSHASLDFELKERLNYKKLITKDLKRNQKYTLPISFDKN